MSSKDRKSAAEECCAKCEKDIAALRKEIVGLKRELASTSKGGSNAKLDKLIEFLKLSARRKNLMEQHGL